MSTVKTTIERAWTDIEPKVYAWLIAGGLLTLVTLIIHYVDPSFALPYWVAPVVTYVGGFVAAYIKKSVTPTVDAPAHSGETVATVDVPDAQTSTTL